jgi:hypothetical protein
MDRTIIPYPPKIIGLMADASVSFSNHHCWSLHVQEACKDLATCTILRDTDSSHPRSNVAHTTNIAVGTLRLSFWTGGYQRMVPEYAPCTVKRSRDIRSWTYRSIDTRLFYLDASAGYQGLCLSQEYWSIVSFYVDLDFVDLGGQTPHLWCTETCHY